MMHDHDTIEPDRFSDLMAQAQQGNQQAYAMLLHALVSPILAFIRFKYPALRDLEDVMQESLVTLHRVRHTYDPTRPFMPWLYAIVRHRCLDHLRKSIRIQQRELQEEVIVANAVAHDLNEMNESTEEAENILARLPEKDRQIIHMLKIDQLSVKDVAEKLGLSESNVKVIASRGYAKLRRSMKDHDADR